MRLIQWQWGMHQPNFCSAQSCQQDDQRQITPGVTFHRTKQGVFGGSFRERSESGDFQKSTRRFRFFLLRDLHVLEITSLK